MDVWNPSSNEKPKTSKFNDAITITTCKHFPYLDIFLLWNLKDDLNFKIYMKLNQKLK